MQVIDQMKRKVELKTRPLRIISLVPSQTELLYDLGLSQEVVGITKFCIYPNEWFRSKTRVGGTKNANLELIKSLQADLIIGNKEENSESDILALQAIAPVWMSDIYTFQDAYEMMQSLGDICGKANEAKALISKIKSSFEQYQKPQIESTAIYLIWNDPLMAAAKNTFIDESLQQFGLTNFYREENRYPLCDPSQGKHPDYVLLSSEPFPFGQKHIIEIQEHYPNSKILLVDGEMFSWYGSRMKFLADYFEKLKVKLKSFN